MRGVVVAVLLLAVAASAEEERLLPACAASKCSGKVLTEFGLLRICVPRGVRSKTEPGAHGDQSTLITIKKRGKRHALEIVLGPHNSGKDPRKGDTRWMVSRWRCTGSLSGEDYRLVADGLYTRYVTLNAIVGFARYDAVPPEVATRFDKILDTLCCGECTVCAAKP